MNRTVNAQNWIGFIAHFCVIQLGSIQFNVIPSYNINESRGQKGIFVFRRFQIALHYCKLSNRESFKAPYKWACSRVVLNFEMMVFNNSSKPGMAPSKQYSKIWTGGDEWIQIDV